MRNIKLNYLLFSGALILMTCSLTACNNSASTGANGAYSNNAMSNEDAATNTQTNSS